MLRIGVDVHAIGARQTGNETYIRNLVDNLIELSGGNNKFILYHTKILENMPWKERIHKVSPSHPALRIPFGFPYVLWRDKIDIAFFQYVIPPFCPCRSVVIVHDISYEFFPEFFHPLSRKRMQLLIPYSAKKSDHILTVSEFSKQQISQKYGIPESKITVTYNGVSKNFRVIDDQEYLDTALSRFDLSSPYILAVGNLQARKNIQRLVRVYASLKAQGKLNQDLVLVGQKHWKNHAIFDEIKKHNVEASVFVTGYVSDEELVALYNRADFFVYPSIYEGFGLPVIESMACGTPVITSNTSSLPEVAGTAALMIDPYDDAELAETMVMISQDQKLREHLITLGLEHIKKFDWKKTALKTLTVLKGVV